MSDCSAGGNWGSVVVSAIFEGGDLENLNGNDGGFPNQDAQLAPEIELTSESLAKLQATMSATGSSLVRAANKVGRLHEGKCRTFTVILLRLPRKLYQSSYLQRSLPKETSKVLVIRSPLRSTDY